MGINLGVWSLQAGEENAAAIEDASHCCSYKEARIRAMRIAAGLYAAGVRPGDGVALFLPISVRATLSIFGIWTAGAAAVPLYYELTNCEIARYLDLAPVKWVLTSTCDADRFADLQGPIQVLDIEEVEQGGDRFAAPIISLDTPALTLFTSGTTGTSKAVIHSAGSVSSQTIVKEPYRALTTACSATGVGIIMPVQTLQAGGTQIVLPSSVKGSQFVKALLDYRADRARVGPEILMSLIESGERLDPSVRLIFGGDFLSARLQQRSSDVLGCHVMQVYGSTETFSMARGNEETPPGAIGATLPQVELQLRSEEDGSVVPGVGQGLAWIRSPKLFMGYGNRGTIERPFDEDGWFKTGDMLRRENDGNYYFLSRATGYLQNNNGKVSPHEIEDALRQEPAVRNAHATSLRLSGDWDTIVAVLEMEKTDSYIAARLNSLMDTHVADFRQPEIVYATHSFPYLPTGKIDARALETQIRSGSLRQIIPTS